MKQGHDNAVLHFNYDNIIIPLGLFTANVLTVFGL